MEDVKKDREVIQALKVVAPGTELREAMSRILSAHTGGLILIGDSEDVQAVINGGFRLDVDFTAPRCYQLCKMDGAVILNDDLSIIRYANVHLVPDPPFRPARAVPVIARRRGWPGRPANWCWPSRSGWKG